MVSGLTWHLISCKENVQFPDEQYCWGNNLISFLFKLAG